MNNYILSFNRISYLLSFLLVGGLFLLSSCEDEDVKGGTPIIERVRFTDQTTADSSFSKATLGSTLAIVGKNLASTQAVYLNNYKVALNPVYVTDNHIIISVFDSVPTIAKDPNVPNELRLESPFGQATYQFQILPPAPIVEQIGNEFAKAGETVTLYGKYFYFVDTVAFPGGEKVTTGITTSADGSSLSVKIPEGFNPSDDDIVVHSQSGYSRVNRATRFYDGEGIVSNFDDVFPWGWGIDKDKNVTTTSPGNVIVPIDNKFALINIPLPGNYGWSNDKIINLVDWGGAQTYPVAPSSKYDPSATVANFDVKLEIAIVSSASLEGIQLQILAVNKNDVELSANVDLKNFVRSTDGKWYTVTVPLSALANGSNKFAKYADVLEGNKGGQHHLRVMPLNTTPVSFPATITVDNVRVVNAVVQ